jgi:predicted ATPase/class 3 adenylate cyclase
VTTERPTGTVAFLFTDIQGSTRLVDQLGLEAWLPVLARHRAIVRAAVSAHAGAEILTEGDSFFVIFGDPANAAAAAADAQRGLAAEPWPAGAEIRVRMGIHVGTGQLDADGSYVGHDVHRAARVEAAAHGGQVLLSEAARDRLSGALPAGVTTRSLGAHRLKDLRPEQLTQLVIDGLPADFPPIRSLDARPNNLPTQLTAFVGRDRELGEVRRLLEEGRLVTLTGPGGTGKTRLALQVAAAASDAFPDGTWFVPLATLSDAALVPSVIASALGVGEHPGRQPVDALAEELEGRTVLLVVDNLEHLPRAVPVVAQLLRRLPNLRMLVTSRAPLRVAGEQEYPVTGLPSPVDVDRLSPLERERLPEAVRRRDPESIGGYEAVRLFVARARAVKPGFELTRSTAPDVAAIVGRLGGVPLAIELAAARIRFLTPRAIHERLGGRLDQPGGASPDLPERQRSLRGAIGWSYDLLEPAPARMLERLAVFTGGFDLAGAEAMTGDIGAEPLDTLSMLVDQSLLQSGEADGEPRFTFLEPIREFALERLDASGDAESVRERHARRMLDLAGSLEPELNGDRQRQALDRLELEHANLRAAIDWGADHADPEVAIGVATAIWRFWQKRGHLTEASQRMASLLAAPWFPPAPLPLRARANEVMGGIRYWHGDFIGALVPYETALAAWREAGDRAEIANALYNLSFCFAMGQLNDEAGSRRAGDLLEEALALYVELGDERGQATVIWGMGTREYFAGDNAAAAATFARGIPLAQLAGDRTLEAWTRHQLGTSTLKLGDIATARDNMREGLRLFDAAGDIAGVTLAFDDLAAVAAAEGDLPSAARLQALARRLQAASGTGLAGVVDEAFEQATRPNATNRVSPVDLARYREEAAGVTLEDGVRFALGKAAWEEIATIPSEPGAAATALMAEAAAVPQGAPS